MRTVFNLVETWTPENKIGVQNKKEGVIVRLVENGVVINPDDFITAGLTTFNPFKDFKEDTKATLLFLEENNLEMFTIFLSRVTFNGVVKPKNISLKEYLEL